MSSPDDLQSRLTRMLDEHLFSESVDGSIDCLCGWAGYEFTKHQAEKLAPVVRDWFAYGTYAAAVERRTRS